MRRLLLSAFVIFSITLPAAAGDTPAALAKLAPSKGLIVLVGDAGDFAPDVAKPFGATLFVQQPKAQADKLRWKLDNAGLLGHRVYVHDGVASLYLADDLADVVFLPPANAALEKEALRVLRPEGRLFIGNKMITKPFREGTDDWKHPYRAPDNNPQSQDTVMKRPYLTHYMAEPWYCPLPMQSVISGGRVFKVFGDRSSAKPQEALINKLLCMNAFNGIQLWQRDLSPGFMIHRNTLIATPDTLYVGDDKSCQLIDPQTGKTRDEIVVPKTLTPNPSPGGRGETDGPVWKWMALQDNILYALVGKKEISDEPLKGDRIRGAGWPWWKIQSYKFGEGRNILAFDAKTKKLLWHHSEQEMIDARGMAMNKSRLFFYSEGKFLAALDAKTGKLVFKNSDKELLNGVGVTKGAQHPLLGFASTMYLKCSDDAVYFAGPHRPMLVAASAKDGKLLWKRDCSVTNEKYKYPNEGGNVHILLRPDGLYAMGQGRINEEMSSVKLDPLTGRVLATFPSRDRCTRATGCIDSIFTRGGKGGSTAVFDVTSQEPRMGMLSPMRPACQDGVVTAHGYLFWGPWMCRCDMTQLGVISLGPGGSFDYTAKATDKDRLEVIYGFDISERAKVDGWPTYRHDNGRSSSIPDDVPTKVKHAWTYTPKSPTLPTAPICVASSVIVGGQDGIVRGIDLKMGKLQWSAYTGGPMKYPPAFAYERIYVGSGDGYVYCLEHGTGKLLWRFRTAPIDRVIPIYGTLSSTWPVGSGVLVDRGTVYCASGISNFDGTHVFALDARKGTIKWQQHSSAYIDDDKLPGGGVAVQGPLLHDGFTINMASGNTPSIASYSVIDGKFKPLENGRGKDLFLRDGKVTATGFPLYWRPEDDQFLSTMELEIPNQGVLATGVESVLRVGIPPANPTGANEFALYPPHKPGEKVKPLWTSNLFQEVAAVAIAKNALVVTGLNRDKKDHTKIDAAVCALDPKSGDVIWRESLPGVPTAWGLALAARGNDVVVTLMDGRVMAFTK